jgi:phosphopentomutase
MARRAFVVVIDACGVGATPDAADYGDEGTNTLAHIAEEAGGLDLPTLEKLGLGSILPLDGVAAAAEPVLHGRLHPLGPGKDTITGHWELMGVVMPRPLPTYPEGFPPEIMEEIEHVTGRFYLGNKPANGIAILDELGEEHLETRAPILYTSADSVLQIAAHDRLMSATQLYGLCEQVREIMSGFHAVGRVIARPFAGDPGSFWRTSERKDFAVAPPSRSYLEEVAGDGVVVQSVGKVVDVFSGRGIHQAHRGRVNEEAIAAVTDVVETHDYETLVFANLVDTDQVYGHRKDVEGFHDALKVIDKAVGRWLEALDPEEDLLIITADHGVDPRHASSDHTREHVPLLAWFGGHGGRRHDGPMADVGASALRWLCGRDAERLPGDPFVA